MPPRERPPRRPTSPDGLLIVDKPVGWTSHDVVARLRNLCGTRKVGHGGTLDPMATGVLVVGVGKATRLLTFVVGADKSYDATIRLGIGTTTDDAEGEIVAAPGFPVVEPSPSVVETVETTLADAVASLTGDIMQVPTTVSAIKVNGQRAYARAREGQDVELAARPVTVSQFDVLAHRPSYDNDIPVLDLDVSVTVSSGTYVRALARDLGAALGTAGHLITLRRTRVGGHTLANARTLDDLTTAADAANADGQPLATLPLADAASAYLPVRHITADEAQALAHGQWITATSHPGTHAAILADPTDTLGARTRTGMLVALIEDVARESRMYAKPAAVMATAADLGGAGIG